jgi:hypothetical protein
MSVYCVWPDGTACLLSELWEFNWKSDDYGYVAADSYEDALFKYNIPDCS